MTHEESQNQDKILSAPKSDASNDSSKSDFCRKIESLRNTTLESCTVTQPTESVLYRVQDGNYGGNCVHFNTNGSDTRFGLNDGQNGTMYVAKEAPTALKEVFQGMSIKESDLKNYYIGTVVTTKELNILDVKQLVRKTGITMNDVTTSSRCDTQSLAKKVRAAGFDGILFPSNVTSDDCIALWHTPGNNADIARTGKLSQLSSFHDENGQSAASILINDLGIPVDLE